MRQIAILAVLILPSCAKDYVDFADDAFDREYWEEAIENYEFALQRETAPDVIERVKKNLVVAKDKASALHVQNCRDALAAKEYDRAIAEAELAYKFKRSPETSALRAEARARKADIWFDKGKAELETGEIDKAVKSLEEAIKIDPAHTEARKKLQEARRIRRDVVDTARKRGDEAFPKREWKAAAQAYEDMLRWQEDAEIRRKAEFARIMEEAEGLLDTNPTEAMKSLEKARAYRYERAYIDRLAEDGTPRDWEITFHSAAILPFKPSSNLPWDGTGGTVAGASDLVTALAELSGENDVRLAKATERILKVASIGTAAPDCQLRVSGVGEPVESQVRRDEHAPTFNLTLKAAKRSKRDKSTLTLTVVDKDDAYQETVGTMDLKLGELLKQEGSSVHVYLTDEKRFRFGGVYGMKISVRRLGP